jgi:hypothetical protein
VRAAPETPKIPNNVTNRGSPVSKRIGRACWAWYAKKKKSLCRTARKRAILPDIDRPSRPPNEQLSVCTAISIRVLQQLVRQHSPPSQIWRVPAVFEQHASPTFSQQESKKASLVKQGRVIDFVPRHAEEAQMRDLLCCNRSDFCQYTCYSSDSPFMPGQDAQTHRSQSSGVYVRRKLGSSRTHRLSDHDLI